MRAHIHTSSECDCYGNACDGFKQLTNVSNRCLASRHQHIRQYDSSRNKPHMPMLFQWRHFSLGPRRNERTRESKHEWTDPPPTVQATRSSPSNSPSNDKPNLDSHCRQRGRFASGSFRSFLKETERESCRSTREMYVSIRWCSTEKPACCICLAGTTLHSAT